MGQQRGGAQPRAQAGGAPCRLLPVAEAPDRTVIELHGTLRTVTLRPRGGTAALEAELFDGTGSLTLVWLGRRRIAGIEPGRALSVTGRVGRSTQDGRVMFNPRYQLRLGVSPESPA